jgi:hypothetical protein
MSNVQLVVRRSFGLGDKMHHYESTFGPLVSSMKKTRALALFVQSAPVSILGRPHFTNIKWHMVPFIQRQERSFKYTLQAILLSHKV